MRIRVTRLWFNRATDYTRDEQWRSCVKIALNKDFFPIAMIIGGDSFMVLLPLFMCKFHFGFKWHCVDRLTIRYGCFTQLTIIELTHRIEYLSSAIAWGSCFGINVCL